MLLLFLLPAFAEATYSITVYGDVLRDTKFFTETYPWIIDNIGGDISVDYYLLGSGRYSVPQMCALSQLKTNTFLQAQFLKCEAEGTIFPLVNLNITLRLYSQRVVRAHEMLH